MYETILAIQYISIIALFVEAVIVFRRWTSRLHSYLIFSIAATLMNNIGYLFELKAHSEEAYFTALQISYFGRVWIPFALLMFALELCRIKVPEIVRFALIGFHTTTYIMVLTTRIHHLYYKKIEFEMAGQFPHMNLDAGIWHMIFMGTLVLYILFGLVMLIITYYKEHNHALRKRLVAVIIAMLTESAFFIMQILGPKALTRSFDLTMLGYTIGTFLMLGAIFRYDLLGAEQLAKEYMADKLSEGIVAVDSSGKIAYFNKPAVKLFPNLAKDANSVVERIKNAISLDEPIMLNDRIYTPRTHTLYYAKEISGTIYILHDNTDMYNYQSRLKREVRRQTARAENLSLEMMIALSKTVDAKDHYTNGHSGRVAEYSAEIARRMGKSEAEQEKIYKMAIMHDIGKIGVSEEIINKTSRLTDEEFAQIKKHTVIGYDILSSITEMPDLAVGARSHHEKFNGTGYPDGLAGHDIPEEARIICVADCYDAMTSMRTYSKPKTQEAVRAEFIRCSGTQFDPEIAAVIIQMIDDDKDYKMSEQGGAKVWKNRHKLRTVSKPVKK